MIFFLVKHVDKIGSSKEHTKKDSGFTSVLFANRQVGLDMTISHVSLLPIV